MLATALYVRLTFCAPMAKKLKANSRIQILKKKLKLKPKTLLIGIIGVKKTENQRPSFGTQSTGFFL